MGEPKTKGEQGKGTNLYVAVPDIRDTQVNTQVHT